MSEPLNETITTAGSPVTLTTLATVGQDVNFKVESGSVRVSVSLSGDNPASATVGELVAAGESWYSLPTQTGLVTVYAVADAVICGHKE